MPYSLIFEPATNLAEEGKDNTKELTRFVERYSELTKFVNNDPLAEYSDLPNIVVNLFVSLYP